MSDPSPGDLVHVPSGVLLVQFDTDGKSVLKHKSFSRPLSLLVVESSNVLHKVLHENNEWYVKASEVFGG